MPQTLHRALRAPASPTSEPCRRGDFGDLCLDLLAAAPHQMELILSLRSPPRLLRNAAGSEALGCHCACVKGGWGKMRGGGPTREGAGGGRRGEKAFAARPWPLSKTAWRTCSVMLIPAGTDGLRHRRFALM